MRRKLRVIVTVKDEANGGWKIPEQPDFYRRDSALRWAKANVTASDGPQVRLIKELPGGPYELRGGSLVEVSQA